MRKVLLTINDRNIVSIHICEKMGGILQDTIEAYNDAEGHHKVRKADDPDKALDLDNIVVTKKKNHQTIHSEGANDPEKLKELAEKKGWSTEHI